MQLPQRARFLLSRSLSSLSSFGRFRDVPVESSNPRLPLPFPPRNPNIPAPTCSDLWGRSGASAGGRRGYCSGETLEDFGKVVDEINLKFMEAREEIDAALDSKDTLYFDEEAECARESVRVVLDMFQGLLARMPEKEAAALRRSMGLKMEQLKAELQELID